jgi:hypothetical protein
MAQASPSSDDDPSSVPPIEAVIGHWFGIGEVHIVFTDDDGRQFILLKETRERFYGSFLAPGQSWASEGKCRPLQGGERVRMAARAYHEAGHAVACIDEGIKVEYVTIVPQMLWNDLPVLGYCQYDYRLPVALEQDCSAWAEKVAMADLGGPMADSLFRQRNELDTSEEVRFAWRQDICTARQHIENKARKEGREVDAQQEVDRLMDAVVTRFLEPWAWGAISRVADRLLDEGAICGAAVKEMVEQAKQGSSGGKRP